MSSKSIKCAHNDNTRVGIGDLPVHKGEPRVYIQVRAGSGERFLANPTRADFLNLVRTELNVIVIDKAELPEVTRDGEYIEVNDEAERISLVRERREELERTAHENLALVAWVDANPPIPEDVRTLMHLIRNAPNARVNGARALAEDLIATGRIDIKEPS